MDQISNPDEIVPDNIRDETFKELKGINKNNICIDCQKKNPKWASIHLGILLCIDCAGKHRQYGVMYSFVKSTNLDVWNRKQILFMQKGGNQRALEYLRKCGALSQTHKHIDYKSPIVQKYKLILTAEVEGELSGKTESSAKEKVVTKKVDIFQEQLADKKPNVPKQISQQVVKPAEENIKKKKGGKKIKGKKIDLVDFDAMVFDDGVPIEEKEKIVRAYEKDAKNFDEQSEKVSKQTDGDQKNSYSYTPPVEVQKEKELSEQQSKQKLEQLKMNQNLKSISSDTFKDKSVEQNAMKNNLNKFSGSSSISSSALFGDGDDNQDQGNVAKIKDFVSQTGGKLYGKLSSYWNKT